MGCAGSGSVAVAGRAPSTKIGIQRSSNDQNASNTNTRDFEELTIELSAIAKIPDVNPVVCLSNESFPVVVSQLFLDDGRETNVCLPIIAATRFGKGRVAALGGISLMLEVNRNRADTEMFLSALYQWGIKRARRVLVCDFPDEVAREAKTFFQQLDLEIETSTSLVNLEMVDLVLVSSSLSVENYELINYVENGGGLICFFDYGNKNAFNMNHILLKMGLAFIHCNFVVGQKQSHRFNIPKKFADVEKLTFSGACETYIEYIKQANITSDKLDSLVTFLKFHLNVPGTGPCNQTLLLAEHSCELLRRIKYYSDGMFCSEMTHVIVLILLMKLLYRLPKEYMKEFCQKLDCDIFPGRCSDIDCGNYSINVDYVPMSWISTGLWLPAGEIARVRCKQNYGSELHIQIGSHSKDLFPSKPRPWKRWPVVTMKYPMTESETEIVSPFGGLIYILATEVDGVKQLELEFENVSPAPVVVMRQPETWNSTKHSLVPWCELQSPDFIFTIPTSFAREHEPEFDKIFDILTRLTHHVIQFTAAPPLSKPYRVVFDPEASHTDESRYPLVFPLEALPNILETEKPTLELLRFLTFLSCLLIRKHSNEIDIDTETAAGTVCACSGILSIWPESDPKQLLGNSVPILFNEFWKIHTEHDNTLITKTLAAFQQPGKGVHGASEDTWIEFFRELCTIAQLNFTPLVQHVRPVPLSVSISLRRFPSCL